MLPFFVSKKSNNMESAPFRGKFLESQFDSIMGHIGWLKKFSVQTYAVMFACVVFGAMNIASTVFIAANTPHTCQVEPEIIKNVTLVWHLLFRCSFSCMSTLCWFTCKSPLFLICAVFVLIPSNKFSMTGF